MERSHFVSQPSYLSESVSFFAKEAHPSLGKVIVKLCRPKVIWACLAIFNVSVSLLSGMYDITISLSVASSRLYKNIKQKLPPLPVSYLMNLLANLKKLGKVIVKFCRPKIAQACLAIFNVFVSLLIKMYEITVSLSVTSYHLYKNIKQKLSSSPLSSLMNLKKAKSNPLSAFEDEVVRLATISPDLFPTKSCKTNSFKGEVARLATISPDLFPIKSCKTNSFNDEVARLATISPDLFQTESYKTRSSETPMLLILPGSKKSLKKNPMFPPERLSGCPPKTGQTTEHPRGTDTSLADFFLDRVTIPGTDLTFWDIAQNRTSEPFLQENMNTIMPILCPSLSPYPNSDAPLLSLRLLHLIQTDPEIASKYLCGVSTILHFLGLEFDYSGHITVREDFEACAARVKNNQNQWQIYQLIRSLLACGFYSIAQNLYSKLSTFKEIKEAYGVSELEITKSFRKKLKPKSISKISDGFDYWKAQIKHEQALDDGKTFDQTIPPKDWVSYKLLDCYKFDIFSTQLEENAPSLIKLKENKGRWCWHLPYLQAPLSSTTKRA